MNENLKNIISFGAHNRIHKEIKEYDFSRDQLESIYNEMESRKPQVNESLVTVVEVKLKALKSLKKLNRITKNIKGKERDFIKKQIDEEKVDLDFDSINDSLQMADVILNASKGVGGGVGAGALTSSAVPLLVGQLASASTGTAISSLSGVAATNATLAWLGGGSIATGGGGMAAGSLVLGGLTFGIGLISAVAFSTVLSHFSANKKIKKIKEADLEAQKMIDQINKNILAFDLIEKRCLELNVALEKSTDLFELELKKVYRSIYKIPILSKSIKSIKKILGLSYFSKNDINEISYIGKIATDYAKLIDTKVLEDEE